jgi:hypothetical protein
MTDMEGIVYGYYQPSTNQWYIGQTINKDIRKGSHKGQTIKQNTKFGKALKEHGFDTFNYEVFETFVSNDIENLKMLLDDKEKEYISSKDSYNNGYNSTLGGRGTLGYKVVTHWRYKIK